MYTPTSILPARIVRSLKGSKRASKHPSTNGKPTVADEVLSSVFEADEGDSCFGDFEEITYDEALPELDHETSTLDTRSLSPLTPRQAPDISAPFALSHHKLDNPRLNHPRSKSVSYTLPEVSLSRSHSRSSLPLFPHSRQSHSRSRVHLPVASTESLLSEFPKPPTHVPASCSRHITLVDPPLAAESRKPRPQEQFSQFPQDPNTQLPSPPSTRPSSPSTIAPSESRSTLTLYRRFQSFKSSLRLPRRSKSHRIPKRGDRDTAPSSAPRVTEFNSLPGVIPKSITRPPAVIKEIPDPSALSPTVVHPVIIVQPAPEPQEEESEKAVPQQAGRLQPTRIVYELVDPLTLTRSPSGCPTPELESLTGTPLPSHSPSWLSRNVRGYPGVEPQPYPSPPPLIVPPPVPVGYVLPPPDPEFISEEEFQNTRILHTPSRPSTPSHRLSSRTPRYCADRSSSLWKSRSPTVVGQSSPSFLQRSNSFTPENSPAPRQGLLFLDTLPRTLSAPDLLAVPSDDNPSLLTPIDLFHHTYPSQPSTSSAPPPPPVPVWPQEPVSTSDPAQERKYEFFVPPPRSQDNTQDQFFQQLPHHILFTVINVLLREASLFSQEYTRMSFNIFGKPMETVDIGHEPDFSNIEWFKDPPPPQMPSPAPAEPFVPEPGVIEQNELFDFALKSAPNVLYAKYKQFGQLGVLGWCAEFSELIDALKQLGTGGDMFVTTRSQALKTCAEILQLHLDVKMQIIVMYLSSQVQRLRRFLDVNGQWEDYPMISFPLPPQGAQGQ